MSPLQPRQGKISTVKFLIPGSCNVCWWCCIRWHSNTCLWVCNTISRKYKIYGWVKTAAQCCGHPSYTRARSQNQCQSLLSRKMCLSSGRGLIWVRGYWVSSLLSKHELMCVVKAAAQEYNDRRRHFPSDLRTNSVNMPAFGTDSPKTTFTCPHAFHSQIQESVLWSLSTYCMRYFSTNFLKA